MSTNYYAHFALNRSDILQVMTALHIGKTANSTAILQGDWFGSWEDWKTFLRYNEDKVTIKDENDVILTVDELIAHFESFDAESRRRQYDWTQNHPDYGSNDHLDADGFTISKGEWF